MPQRRRHGQPDAVAYNPRVLPSRAVVGQEKRSAPGRTRRTERCHCRGARTRFSGSGLLPGDCAATAPDDVPGLKAIQRASSSRVRASASRRRAQRLAHKQWFSSHARCHALTDQGQLAVPSQKGRSCAPSRSSCPASPCQHLAESSGSRDRGHLASELLARKGDKRLTCKFGPAAVERRLRRVLQLQLHLLRL